MLSGLLIFDGDLAGAADLAETGGGVTAGLAGVDGGVLAALAAGVGVEATGAVFLAAAGLAAAEGAGLAVLAVVVLAAAVLAVAGDADLLDEADVFVTGSSFPKCVIH
jgi:hypothetical protein